jgi:antitoxin HigA-1
MKLIPLLNPFAETLRETIDEWQLSQAKISRIIGIPSPHLSEMKHGKRRCTPEYDLRLSQFFGMTPGLWLNLQTSHDLQLVEREKGAMIRKQIKPQQLITA